MAQLTDWVAYNQSVKKVPELLDLWRNEGMTLEDVEKWGLGWTNTCPVLPDHASLTIPVFFQGTLMDIRHKLLGELDVSTGRYRSHISGILPFPFNLDVIYQHQHLIVVEGEKKPIHLTRGGLTGVVGIPGATVTDDLLMYASSLEDTQTITLALDPGAGEHAERLADDLTALGVRVFIAHCFAKPDDLLLRYGADVLKEVISQSQLWR